MATTAEQDNSRASRMSHYTTDDDEEEEEDVKDSEGEEDKENEEEEEEEEDDVKDSDKIDGCWPISVVRGGCGSRRASWSMGQVLDPRAKWVQEWNRVFLLVCATGLFVDPLFFYALSISDTCTCLFVDGWFAITVTALRCMTDALHVWNMWLQMKMAERSFGMGAGSGLRDTTRRSVALRYLKTKRGFFFDLFVILPIPQVRISLTLFPIFFF